MGRPGAVSSRPRLLQPRGGSAAAAAMGAAEARQRRWGVPVLLVAYVGYVGLGAGVLQALERPAEVQAAQRLLHQHWELLANHTCLRGAALQRLIQVSPCPRRAGPPRGGYQGGFSRPRRLWLGFKWWEEGGGGVGPGVKCRWFWLAAKVIKDELEIPCGSFQVMSSNGKALVW